MSNFSSTKEPEIRLEDAWNYFNAVSRVGIFELIDDAPWEGIELSSRDLNDEYFGNHSGSKFCSPIVKRFLGEDETLSVSAKSRLAHIITTKYIAQWSRLWNTYILSEDYDPFENYNVTETIDGTIADTGTDTWAYGKVSTLAHGHIEALEHGKVNTLQNGKVNTLTHNTTETTTPLKTETTVDSVKGFNSSESVESNRSVYTEGGTIAVAKTGSDTSTNSGSDISTDSGTDTTRNTGSDTTTLSGSDVETKNLQRKNDVETTRRGKIGSTTQQYILKEERSLWVWNFFEQIYRDVDNVLTIAYQDPCAVF